MAHALVESNVRAVVILVALWVAVKEVVDLPSQVGFLVIHGHSLSAVFFGHCNGDVGVRRHQHIPLHEVVELLAMDVADSRHHIPWKLALNLGNVLVGQRNFHVAVSRRHAAAESVRCSQFVDLRNVIAVQIAAARLTSGAQRPRPGVL